MNKDISVTVNGRQHKLTVDIRETLLETLRGRLGLTGAKEGCSVGECGACTAIVDGNAVDTCIYLAVWADGRSVTTIEGIEGTSLSDVQASFIEAGAVQCGYCTPGMVLSATAFLEKNPSPDRQEIRRGLSGNLCRCTGYMKIIDAVERTVEKRGGDSV